MMDKVLIWGILNYGLMNIMLYGSIFKSLRDFFKNLKNHSFNFFSKIGIFLDDLFSCPMCFSTWGGFLTSIFIFSPTHSLYNTSHIISWFFDGLISSGIVWSINAIIEFFEESRIN